MLIHPGQCIEEVIGREDQSSWSSEGLFLGQDIEVVGGFDSSYRLLSAPVFVD
jgi:hypothetical protein